MTAATGRFPPGRRTYAFLALGFLLFTLYGSFVPFHFEPLPWDEGLARWDRICSLPVKIVSRSDFLANILLFIPLAWLLTGMLALDRGRLVAVPAALLVIAACAGLSTAIEFTQLWFPPRVTSLSDIAGETVGSIVGAGLWVIVGQRCTDYLRAVYARLGPGNLAVKLLPVYVIALVLIHTLPLDLTLSPVEIYHKWKEGRVILVPFTTDYGTVRNGLLKNALNVAYFLPLGVILSLWPGRPFRALAGAGSGIASGGGDRSHAIVRDGTLL